ncbi:MAG: hypothetical protein ABL977_01840 [Candidatus Eisenbacteria bacterium]
MMLPGWLLEAGAVAGAVADTVASASRPHVGDFVGAMGRDVPFAEQVERWHDFYLMAGTAAVTLAGLLFVALSLHLDLLVEVGHEHLLGLSRATLTTFVSVLIVSLFMLVPSMSMRMTGLLLMIVAAAGLITTVYFSRHMNKHHGGALSPQQMRRRTLMPLIAYLLILSAGAGVYLGAPEMLFNMIGGICMILGNAAGTSWELLVRVAQHKRAAAKG